MCQLTVEVSCSTPFRKLSGLAVKAKAAPKWYKRLTV